LVKLVKLVLSLDLSRYGLSWKFYIFLVNWVLDVISCYALGWNCYFYIFFVSWELDILCLSGLFYDACDVLTSEWNVEFFLEIIITKFIPKYCISSALCIACWQLTYVFVTHIQVAGWPLMYHILKGDHHASNETSLLYTWMKILDKT